MCPLLTKSQAVGSGESYSNESYKAVGFIDIDPMKRLSTDHIGRLSPKRESKKHRLKIKSN